MTDIGTGLFLRGAANQRNVNRDLGLRERAIGVEENQVEIERQKTVRNQVMEAIGNTTDQAVSLVQGASSREQPGFSNTLSQIRANVEALAVEAERAGIGITAGNVLSTFDNAVLSTQTAGETAETEAQSAIAGATATAQGVASLPPEQRAGVERVLGLTDPQRSQEFFGLLEILEDPNASPLAKEMAGARMEATTNNSESQFVVTADRDGNITVSQGPAGAAIPQRATLNAGQLDDLRAAGDIVKRGIEISTALTANTDTALGALGSLRRGAQTFTGVVSDLLGISTEDITSEFEGLLSQVPPETREAFSVGEVDAAEGILTFAVARALQGDSNRLLTASIGRAQQMVKLTGAVSEEQVRDRLNFISQFLQSQDANFQRRLEQGTSGTATTEREPAMPSPESLTPDEAINRIDAILGGGGG